MNDLPERVVETAISQLGSPYVFGAWGAFCTPSERKKRYNYNPNHPTILSKCQVLRSSDPKPNCDGCIWKGDRCFDCRGFTDWTLKQVGIDLYGEGATTQYSHKENWIERGLIADMPECVCCVFVANGNKKSHTGLYIGGGETIECSGEVKRLPLAKKWTHYAIPAGLYTIDEIDEIRKTHPRPKDTINKTKGVMLMTVGQDVAPLICGATGLPCCECMPCCSNRTLSNRDKLSPVGHDKKGVTDLDR